MESIENKIKRTVESILDLETGKEIQANDFFKKPIDEIFQFRYKFENAIRKNEPRFVCYYCKQSIKIRGSIASKMILHFAHVKDSDDCSIKTNSRFTKEEILRIKYNGAKESCLHHELKSFIAGSLETNRDKFQGVELVEVEKTIKHQSIPHTWKRPDITCIYLNKSVVFELQLSTTFLSVINSRQEFYKENKTYILWVFNSFETANDRRKFTQSDVFYNNNQNGFEIDNHAKEQSIIEHDLVLKCNYLKPYIKQSYIQYIWEFQYVKLSDLTFNNTTFQVYYYDVNGTSEYLQSQLQIGQSRLIQSILFGEVSEICELFKNEYNVTESERKHIISLYKTKVSSQNIIDVTTVEFRIILTTILLKINKINLIREFIQDYTLRKTINDILSLKLNKIVGYSYQKQIQISHRLLETRPQHMNMYLRAIQEYKPNLITLEDKSNRLKEKINKVKQSNVIQQNNNRIIEILFPELT